MDVGGVTEPGLAAQLSELPVVVSEFGCCTYHMGAAGSQQS